MIVMMVPCRKDQPGVLGDVAEHHGGDALSTQLRYLAQFTNSRHLAKEAHRSERLGAA